MTSLNLVIASIFISTAFNAVYGYPGSTQLHRIARSPHYGGFGFPPPPPPPPPPFPFFQTNNWSGVAKGADGNTRGVYSGATASATNTGSARGQALSLASADCDDDDSVQSTGSSGKLLAGGNTGGISGGFGGQFSEHKEAQYSFQSGGGKFEAKGSGLNGQSTTGSQGQFNLGASSAGSNFGAPQPIKSGFSSSSQSSAQSGGKLSSVDQSGGFSSSSAHSSAFGQGKDNGGQQLELVSGGLNSQDADCEDQEQANLNTQSGFAQSGFGNQDFNQNKEQNRVHSQQYGVQKGSGFNQQGSGSTQQTLTSSSQQNQVGGGFGQQKKQWGDFSQQQTGSGQQNAQLKEHQAGFNGGYGQQSLQSGYGQQQGPGAVGQKQNNAAFGQSQGQGAFVSQQGQATLSQGQQFKQNLQGGNGASSQASSYAQGSGFGYGKGAGYGHGGNNDFNSKYQANQDLQQQQSGSELANGSSESKSAGSQDTSIGGAFNLASQGLEAAQKAACSTCGGNGGYAFSNAKSHSGSAISVAIGG